MQTLYCSNYIFIKSLIKLPSTFKIGLSKDMPCKASMQAPAKCEALLQVLSTQCC